MYLAILKKFQNLSQVCWILPVQNKVEIIFKPKFILAFLRVMCLFLYLKQLCLIEEEKKD